MPLPPRNHNRHPLPMHRPEPPPQFPDLVPQDLIPAPHNQTLLHHAIQTYPPLLLRDHGLAVRVALYFPALEGPAPQVA